MSDINPEIVTVYTPEVSAILDRWVAVHGLEPRFQVLVQRYDDQGHRIIRTVEDVRIVGSIR
jgi:hypothetical protein